jgi:hypothetical protein
MPCAGAAQEWTEERPADISRISLESIEFEGQDVLSESELRHVVRTSKSGLGRFRSLDLERVDGDVARLRNHFRRLGHWNVKVERRLLFYAHGSDHWTLHEAGVPSIGLWSGDYQVMHTKADTRDGVDPAKIERIARALAMAALAISGTP